MGGQHLAALEEAWRAEPFPVFVRLADAYRRAGRAEDARAVLAHGLAARPGHLAARVLKARLWLDARRIGDARAELHEVLALRPSHWTGLELLASVERAAGDGRAELELVEQMHDLQPGDPAIAERLETLRADDGARPAMPRRRDRALILDAGAGETSPARPRPQPGIPAAALRQDPAGDPFVNATMAELLAAQGDVDGARAMLAELVARSPQRDSLRARYVELGGSADDVPPPVPEDDGLSERLEAVLRDLVED